ncbi:MAG: hypothetical protein QM493_04945 [Sulfurovum sp.]
MLYYYAHSGHKIGLDRVRRGSALLKSLKRDGIDGILLVNDFRAGLACREMGLSEYITIETIQDIDAIASIGDSIIIDSDEDDHGRMVKYCSEFKSVFRFANSADDSAMVSEIVLDRDSYVVDAGYFEDSNENNMKNEKIVFFLGDADYDKIILNNSAFFDSFDMELILGNYFFVKYEDDLSKLFSALHEPEDYEDIIKSSSCVVTASAQTALEAAACGTKVIFLDIERQIYSKELLESVGIVIVDGFNSKILNKNIKNSEDITKYYLSKFDNKNIRDNI